MVGPEVPEQFVEDPGWIPDAALFDRYAPDADLGLLFTDGEYDVVVYETVGPPAVDAFDALRLGTDGPAGATDPEALDPTRPLLVLSRRAQARPFAALQRWELVEELIAQDRPRLLRNEPPAPSLRSDGAGPRRRALGWAIRSVLVLALGGLAVVVAMLAIDADGPIAYRMVDDSTAANPFADGAQLAVVAASGGAVVDLPSGSASPFRDLASLRWSLNTPLTITYTPGTTRDEQHTVTLDLRERGATGFTDGRAVRITVRADDDTLTLSVLQPTQRWLTLERVLAYEVSLQRTRAPQPAQAPDPPPAAPRPRPPASPGGGFNQCVRDAVDEYLPLLEDFDLVSQYRELEADYLADGSVSLDEGRALAGEMRRQADDLRALLFYSGILRDRPPSSSLPGLFELQFQRQERLAAAWEASGGDGSIGELNAALGAFIVSANFLDFGAFSSFLDEDARITCLELDALGG